MQDRGTAKTAYRQDLYVTWSFEEKLPENKAVNINPQSIYGLISKLWLCEASEACYSSGSGNLDRSVLRR